MEKRLTKKDYFNKIMEVCADNAEIVAFCEKEIEMLGRKNSKSTPNKTQVENEGIKKEIVSALERVGEAVTISDLQAKDATMATYSNQKLSALLKQLVESDVVVKTTEKKKSYFSVKGE